MSRGIIVVAPPFPWRYIRTNERLWISGREGRVYLQWIIIKTFQMCSGVMIFSERSGTKLGMVVHAPLIPALWEVETA